MELRDKAGPVTDRMTNPDVVRRIAEIMQREHRPSDIFPFPALDDPPVETDAGTAAPH